MNEGTIVSELRDIIAVMESALDQIASSHWERVGYDQTDIDDVPNLSAEEAMLLARRALSETAEKYQK